MSDPCDTFIDMEQSGECVVSLEMRALADARGWTNAPVIAGAPPGVRWKTTRERALRKARRFVVDLAAGDERLLEALVVLACKAAARRWRSEMSCTDLEQTEEKPDSKAIEAA